MKKIILILVLLGFTVLSCRTQQEQAQRHLKKAIEKDPNILSKRTLDTMISGVAKGLDTAIRKGTQNVVTLNCDSILKVLNSVKAKDEKGGVKSTVLYADSAKTLEVLKKPNGKLYARLTTPPDTVIKEIRVPFHVYVKVPGELITKTIPKPIYSYFWFWIMALYILLTFYVIISRVFFKKDYVEKIIVRNGTNNTDTKI